MNVLFTNKVLFASAINVANVFSKEKKRNFVQNTDSEDVTGTIDKA